jgi:hypothetical protein
MWGTMMLNFNLRCHLLHHSFVAFVIHPQHFFYTISPDWIQKHGTRQDISLEGATQIGGLMIVPNFYEAKHIDV